MTRPARIAMATLGLFVAFNAGCSRSDGWTDLFNGEDLTGWQAEGEARWFVEDGCLVGTQGPNNEPGDLFTEETFGDFDLVTTYRMVWPANSGIWFRYVDPKTAYQADILEHPKPVAFSGTLYCPGRMFLDVNLDKSIVNKDGWNTMRIKCVGDHLQIWLNDTQVGDVKDDAIPEGKIGFQIHQGDQFKTMKIVVREMKIKKICAETE